MKKLLIISLLTMMINSSFAIDIVDIQTPGAGSDSSLYKGSVVSTNGIVTAVKPGTGYWIQNSAGGPYSGLYIFDALNTPFIGDDVSLTGEVDEYFGLTEIKNVSTFSINSSNNQFSETYLSTSQMNDEQYEGVFVVLTNATCNSAPNGFGEWLVNDGSGDAQIDDFIYSYSGIAGFNYTVKGVVSYSFGSYELFPRRKSDIQYFVDITDIQTPGAGSDSSLLNGDTVGTRGIVTAKGTFGYWIQKSAGGAYSGIYVFDNINSPNIGDMIDVIGEVEEYNTVTEIKSVSSFNVLSLSNAFTITPLSTNNCNNEMYEGVMLSVIDAICNTTPNGFGEWIVNDGSGDLIIDAPLYPYGATINTDYDIKGVLGFTFGNYKLYPRFTSDIDSNVVAPIPSVTITQIQTPGAGNDSSLYKGDTVMTSGVVTAVSNGNGYWLQQTGGGAYSGVYVFDGVNTPSIGDMVDLTGEVDEFFGLTEIVNVSAFNITSAGNNYVITNLSTSAVNDEMYEGVMVTVSNATCNSTPNGFGEWIVNDGSGDLQIDDPLYPYGATLNTVYDITGVVGYGFGNYELFPRFIADIDSNAVVNPSGSDTLNLTIVQIQTPVGGGGDSPYVDSIINTSGIVTAIKPGTGYWIQQSIGGPYSGIYVYDNVNTPSIGDNVTLVAQVDEFFNLTELKNVTTYIVNSSSNAFTITNLPTNGVNAEQYESVMVSVNNATCISTPNGFGEWSIDDGSGNVVVNDFIFSYGATLGTVYDVTGVVEYNFSEFKILPRFISDIDSNGVVNPPGSDTLNLTISQVQTPVGGSDDSPYIDSLIETTGIVTAVKAGTGYWLQEASGGAYSGVYVFDGNNVPSIGDELSIVATVDEFFNLTELKNVVSYALLSSNNSFVITELPSGNVGDEMYEGVMVKVLSSSCIQDTNQYAEWIVDDASGNIQIDDFMYTYDPVVGEVYNVTGPVSFGFGFFEIYPRFEADVELSVSDTNSIFNSVKINSIYPNPVSNVINIEFKSTENAIIRVVDLSGKIMLTQDSIGEISVISLENLKSGLYFIEIITKNGMSKSKFIKN